MKRIFPDAKCGRIAGNGTSNQGGHVEELVGRGAVITGGASGIGLATARRLGSRGARVVLADVERLALDAAVEELRALLEPVAGQLESVTRLTNRLPGGRKYRRAQAEADDVLSTYDHLLHA